MYVSITVLEIIKSFQCNSTLFETHYLSRVDGTKLLSAPSPPPDKLKRGNVIVCMSWKFTVYLTFLTEIHTNELIFPYEELPMSKSVVTISCSSFMLMDCILLKKENRVNRLWVISWHPWYITWSFYRWLTLHFQTLAYRKLKTCHQESHDQWSCLLELAVKYYLLFS